MPEKIILHVGPHKTGSTAIQLAMASDRSALLDEGILYPQSGCVASAHHWVCRYCEGSGTTFDPGEMRAEAEEASVVVISSENFVLLAADGLARFRALFPKTPIRVIYYLRCLCDLWPSHWQELVKHGVAWSFPEYVMKQALGHGQRTWSNNNQFEQLSRLAAGFGKHAIGIVGYDVLRAEEADIGRHFQTAVIGREATRVTGKSPVFNLSLESWQVELIRTLNTIHRSRVGGPPTDTIRRLVLERLHREEPPWIEEFRALVDGAPRFELSSENPCVEALQRRVLRKFGYAVVGNYDAVEAAYLAPRKRKVPLFELPLGSRDRLRRALLDYHLELIGASADAIGVPTSS